MDEKLQLSGNYSRDGRWAELADKGWVFAAQIDAPNKPKVQSQARRSYERYDTEEDSYTMESDSSLWRGPAGVSYGTDTGVVYGPGSYSYRPRMGVGYGPGWGQHRGSGFGSGWGQYQAGGHHRRN
jgi:hypothetical protein